MKFCSFIKNGQNRVGAQTPSGKVVDITIAYTAKLKADGNSRAEAIANILTPPDMIGLIESGDAGIAAVKEAIAYVEGEGAEACQEFLYAPDEIQFRAPVPNPEKLCAVVQNTIPVITNEKTKKPEVPLPLYGFTPATAISGPYDPVEVPKDSGVVGSEAELALIFGKKAKYVEPEDAMDYVYGYTIHNDVSGLEIQEKYEWIHNEGDILRTYAGRCKCMDSWSPMGPWLYTADEVEDPNNLRIKAFVNDVLIQDGNTSEMYHKIPDMISYLTYGHTFNPGDIISWGNVYSRIDGLTAEQKDLLGSGGNLVTEIVGLGEIVNPIKPIDKVYVPRQGVK